MKPAREISDSGGRPLVSFFVHNLAHNPIVRAAPIAVAFEHLGWDVEIIGYLAEGAQVYEPFRNAFTFRTLPPPRKQLAIWRDAFRLASLARGSLIYAFKPLHTTLWPAFLAARRLGHRRQLALDIEDDELPELTWDPRAIWRYRYTLGAHVVRRSASFTTVASRVLQSRYGGQILRYATSNPRLFEAAPAVSDPESRRMFGLPQACPLILFAGVPHPYKGLDDAVAALQDERCSGMHLVLAGDPAAPAFQRARTVLGDRCHVLGMIDNDRMPALLRGVDVVPVLQRDTPIARAQLPAKAMEALAAGRTVVGTTVGDLPEILGHGGQQPRGWIIDHGFQIGELASLLASLCADPVERHRRATAGQRYAFEVAHPASLARQLDGLLARGPFREKPAIVAATRAL